MEDEARAKLGLDARPRDELADELDAIYLLATDLLCVANADGRFRRVSPSWTKCLGYSREELLNRPWLDFVHPDDKARTVEVARSLEGADLVSFENRYRHKDGSYRTISWRALKWTAGLTFAIARDVTSP